MKNISITALFLLGFSLHGLSQPDSSASCLAAYEWEVNNEIMMFAPGMAVNFFDQSEGDVVNWFWDFGDGSFSEEQNPMHIFTFLDGNITGADGKGIYIPKVCLTITTMDSCSSSTCKTLDLASDTITLPNPGCYVSFYPYHNDTIVTIPEVVPFSFRISAPENTVSYRWDFGDGTTSEEADPMHTFDFMGGVFIVCLEITTADGCSNSYCTPVYIGNSDSIPEPGCQAYYTYSVMESYPEQYAFQDLSRGTNPTAWFWDFGDGTYSSEQNPVHTFWEINDSLEARVYLGPPIADHYKVCLTVVNDDNCKSTYCDVVYLGGVIDTLYPQPCPYFISLTTSNILGGNFCNGSASASLVDAAGNPVEAEGFFWSTGETGPDATGLCVNRPYYVGITGTDGCLLMGSFAIIDYTRLTEPFGFWTIYGFGSSYDLSYSAPGAGYLCTWQFSDGTILSGETVNFSAGPDSPESVTLNVHNLLGNLVYSEVIALKRSTDIEEREIPVTRLFPNPAVDEIHIVPGEEVHGDLQVEIYSSTGQKMISERFTGVFYRSELIVPVNSLKSGIYFARILGAGEKPETLVFVK